MSAPVEPTPYERGNADGLAGKPPPPYPGVNSSWEDRFYSRGWEAGIAKRAGTEPRVDVIGGRGLSARETELLVMLRDRARQIATGIDAALAAGMVKHTREPLKLWRDTAPGVPALEALLEGR